ncbi:MAG: hypothetical protein J6B63_03485 [Treponema sp.]|nr:hypothetical protein [Treponema sp.]
MEIERILSSINEISDNSEKYFLDLGSLFPSLLNRDNSTSLQELQEIFSDLGICNKKSSNTEEKLFNGYAEKYNPLFEELNSKIKELSELDKMIAGIKEDSEQMGLIALNAMVISIKSGEKGQAFSRITENLQRLANDMSLFSDKLLDEEKQLIEHINTLKQIFSNILDSQKELSSKGSMGTNSVQDLINDVVAPLNRMETNINEIYPPIQKAMENLQLQDIIRQALGHITSCLNEINNTPNQIPDSDGELDSICFNIALYELSIEVLNDIINHINVSFSEFNSNWNIVTNQLSTIDSYRKDFFERYLDELKHSPDNISERLTTIITHFQKNMEEFSRYHLVQKDLLHTCQSINEKARTMRSVFNNLQPVMSRLHHVRILQQIEVAKNEAIKSVTDSVSDMDKLIQSANESLEVMEELLDTFIRETSGLLSNFTNSISTDNNNMISLRKEKNSFFEELRDTKNQLASIITNFTVFPYGFEEKCSKVKLDLDGIEKLGHSLTEYKETLHYEKSILEKKKEEVMQRKNILNWTIQNSKFSEVIEHFTITAHKEAAGKLCGFNVESGTKSGEITFF